MSTETDFTAADAPYTALEFVVRELRSAAYDGAMDVALRTTEADTDERRTAVREAGNAFDLDVDGEARNLLGYLARHFGSTITADSRRLNDERVPAAPARERHHVPLVFRERADGSKRASWGDWRGDAAEEATWD